jgi:extradiol dioxygenase family protein
MQVKSIFQSKTLGANVLALGIAVYQHYFGMILPADPQWFALAIAAINIGLRFTTSQPVSL